MTSVGPIGRNFGTSSGRLGRRGQLTSVGGNEEASSAGICGVRLVTYPTAGKVERRRREETGLGAPYQALLSLAQLLEISLT